MDHAESARRHRNQAEECRARADLMGDQETRAQYQKMADSYDAIADTEEKLAAGPQRTADSRKPESPGISSTTPPPAEAAS
jgi:hypothetical protein